MTDEFAAYAEIYDPWVATGPFTEQHGPFYLDEFVKAGGPCVEIGVGSGRITIAAAIRGVDIIGVDVSPAMLSRCRERAVEAGVADRVRLIEADMRTFALPQPASLVALPFSTIGHVLTLDGKAAAFRRIHSQLLPGGRLVFDSLVFDPTVAAKNSSLARLRAEFRDERTGEDALLWVAPTYDVPNQRIRFIAWTDRIDAKGVVTSRRYCRLDFSFVTPEQTRSLLEGAGFEIEHCFGGFDRSSFTPESKTQIWIARRTK